MPALSKTSPTKVSPTGKKLSVKINAVAQHSPKKSPTSVSQAGSDYHQQQQSVSGSPTSGTVTQSLTSSIANTRAILTVFEKYQKERLGFVQTIADFASREHNIEVLQTAGVMALLKPLLGDPVPAIQQAAAVALGRLANYNLQLATAVVNSDVLPHLIYSLKEQNRFYKKAAAFVLRSVARHSPQLAQAVVNSGATQSLVNCLEEFDPSVKESAAWALGYIARHNGDLAQSVVDAGAIPLFALCLQEPELPLKRIAASALSDIAKHSPDLAQAVVDSGCIPLLASFLHIHRNQINSVDPKLQRQAINCLANVAKHTLSLAEAVVDGEIVPGVYACFKGDSGLKRHAATLVCEIVKHSVELGQLVANSGGIPALVEYVSSSRGGNKVPGVMALGYLAGMNEVLAMSVVVSKGVPVLVNCLNTSNGALEDYGSHVADDKTAASSAHAYGGDDEKEIAVEYVKAASCWALGQIGKHSPEHAKSLNAHAVLPKLLAVLNSVQPLSSVSPNAALDDNNEKEEAAEDDLAADLRLKAKRALKAILGNTLEASALEPVLQKITPPNILKYVISQYAKILPSDIAARRAFVISGGLARVQEIAAIYAVGPVSSLSAQQQQPQAQPAKKAGVTVVGTQQDSFLGSKLAESIRTINECYPEEIVRYYSPGYSNTLLAKLDSYTSAGGQSQNPVITRTAFDGAENGGKEEQPNAAAGAQ